MVFPHDDSMWNDLLYRVSNLSQSQHRCKIFTVCGCAHRRCALDANTQHQSCCVLFRWRGDKAIRWRLLPCVCKKPVAALPFGLLISNPAFHDWGSISILICSVCFLCFSSFLFTFFKGRAKTVSEYIGRNTFPIFVFHPIFTMLSKFLLPFFRFEPTGLLHAFFTIVMCIAGSLCMAKLMDRTRLSFLLGRKRILR